MTNAPTNDLQIDSLKQYRTFGGDKPLPGERTPMDRFVCAAYDAAGLQQPADRGEAAAFIFSVICNVPVPFGLGDPDKPNVARAIFQTVQDLTGRRWATASSTTSTSGNDRDAVDDPLVTFCPTPTRRE